MRVLHVTNMWPIPGRPEFGIFVKTQIDSLAERGITNEVVFIEGHKSKLNYLAGIKNVHRALRGSDFDLVHVHYGLTALATSCVRNRPVVISYCGTDLLDPTQSRISKLLALTARRHIVKSNLLKKRLGIKSAVVLPNGVDTRIFYPMDKAEARQRLNLSLTAPLVIFVANPNNPIKRFELAKQVVDRVRENVPNLELVVVRGKSQQEVALFHSAADVLLVTSAWEGSPNVVKEAMACSLPIVATDVGDIRERLQSVVPSYAEDGSVETLALRVGELVLNPKRSNGHEIIQELSLSRVAERLEQLYIEMIEKSN